MRAIGRFLIVVLNRVCFTLLRLERIISRSISRYCDGRHSPSNVFRRRPLTTGWTRNGVGETCPNRFGATLGLLKMVHLAADEIIGKTVRNCRMQAGLDPEFVANTTGISIEDYRRGEMGIRRFTSEELFLIAVKLKVNVADFLDRILLAKNLESLRN
jgi:hypothetical protein